MRILSWWKEKTYTKCEVSYCNHNSTVRYKICAVNNLYWVIYLCNIHFEKASDLATKEARILADNFLLKLET